MTGFTRSEKPLFLGAEGERQYALLVDAIEIGSGFELFFLVSPSRFVWREIQARLGAASIPRTDFRGLEYPHADDLRNLLKDLLEIQPPETGRRAILVRAEGTDDEQQAGWPRALGRLNEQRNRLIRACPAAILLVVPPSVAVLAAERYPDLWSVRSSVFHFPYPPATEENGSTPPLRFDLGGDDELMAHQLESGDHYSHLARALEGSPREPEQRTRARLLRRAAKAWRLRGDNERAKAALQSALAVYEGLSDARESARIRRDLCGLLFQSGELESAREILSHQILPVFEQLRDEYERAETLDRIADILQSRGELDEALRIRQEEQLPVYEKLGKAHDRAVTLAKIADIHFLRGDLAEALRIRQQECLPIFQPIGDIHSSAVIHSGIGDILQARGKLDEALRVYRTEVLPIYESLGDVRGRAVTLGKIGDILQSRGEFDAALRIRLDEELPVYEKLGDIRSRAVTLGCVADLLIAKGEWSKALHILEDERLPVFEKLGDMHGRATTFMRIAEILILQNKPDKALRILRTEVLPVHESHGDIRGRAVALGKMAHALHALGKFDEALRIRRNEELPLLMKLGDPREILVARANLAIQLLEGNSTKDRKEARRLLRKSLQTARRLRLREASQIEDTLKQAGLT